MKKCSALETFSASALWRYASLFSNGVDIILLVVAPFMRSTGAPRYNEC